jgi:hypothetical protein
MSDVKRPINAVDKLARRLQMSPADLRSHALKLVEQAASSMGQFGTLFHDGRAEERLDTAAEDLLALIASGDFAMKSLWDQKEAIHWFAWHLGGPVRPTRERWPIGKPFPFADPLWTALLCGFAVPSDRINVADFKRLPRRPACMPDGFILGVR